MLFSTTARWAWAAETATPCSLCTRCDRTKLPPPVLLIVLSHDVIHGLPLGEMYRSLTGFEEGYCLIPVS